MDQELLVDRLEALKRHGAAKNEILRQLQPYPQLQSGAVLQRAKLLASGNGGWAQLTEAYEWLKPFIPLGASYCTSSGPLGTTHEEVTALDLPKKPMWGVTLIVLFALVAAGCFLRLLRVGYDSSVFGILTLGAAVLLTFVWIERQVAKNKWEARQRLNRSIIEDAERFEAIIEECRPVLV